MLTICAVPLLDKPLCLEQQSHLCLKDLWLTSVTSKNILWSHIGRAARTAVTISRTPPPNDWIVYEPPSEARGESVEEPVKEPVEEWEDVPEFEPSHEMLANVYDDAEQGETVSVDADWCVLVSVKLVPPLPSDMSSHAYATYDTFEGISLTAQLNSHAILTAKSLLWLSSPTAWLNDDCINICTHLLHSLFPA